MPEQTESLRYGRLKVCATFRDRRSAPTSLFDSPQDHQISGGVGCVAAQNQDFTFGEGLSSLEDLAAFPNPGNLDHGVIMALNGQGALLADRNLCGGGGSNLELGALDLEVVLPF